MPHGNFDEILHADNNAGGNVEARGPLDPGVHKVTDMCVWVIQRNGANDVIANNMGRPVKGNPPEPGKPEDEHAGHGMGGGMPGMGGDLTIWDRETADARWTFTLPQKFQHFTFAEGGAMALAVAVFEDAAGTQRAFVWSETVELTYEAIPPSP